MVKKSIQHIREWYQHNFSWKGAAAVSWLLAKEIPSMFSREKFWSTNLPVVWRYIYAHSTIITVLVVAFIIWLDNRRILRKQAQRYDLKTLEGRTLKFCDDLEAFKRELGAEPPVNWTTGNSPSEFAAANEPLTIREQKMHHGFQLRFAETAWKLWHEHGAERREDPALEGALRGRIDCDDRINPIIEHFRELAEMTQAIEAHF